MLYKHSFSILCGHLNLNQKRKKFEFGRLSLKPDRFTSLTGRLTGGNRLNCHFWFEIWIWPVFLVTGQTVPVYRNRRAAVLSHRSVKKNPGHEWIPHFHSVHSPQRHLPEKRKEKSYRTTCGSMCGVRDPHGLLGRNWTAAAHLFLYCLSSKKMW